MDLKFPGDPDFLFVDAATEEPTVKVNVATDTSADLKFPADLKFCSVDAATEEPTVKLGDYALTVVDTDGGTAEKPSEMGFSQVNVATDTSVDLKFRVDLRFRLVDAATEVPIV